MKLSKIHSLLTIYLIVFTFVYLYNDLPSTKLAIYGKFIVIVGIIEIIFFINIFYTLFYKNVIAYSKLFQQILIIIICYFFFQITNYYYFYILIIITMLIYFFIKKFHEYKLVEKKNEHYLVIRNKLIINVIYIVYGVISYALFIISNENFSTYFYNIDDAFFIVFSPYIIIVMILFSLQYDNTTDIHQTKKRFVATRNKLIFKRNLLINSICIWFLVL